MAVVGGGVVGISDDDVDVAASEAGADGYGVIGFRLLVHVGEGVFDGNGIQLLEADVQIPVEDVAQKMETFALHVPARSAGRVLRYFEGIAGICEKTALGEDGEV